MKDGINQCGGSGIESVDHFDGVGIVRIRPVVNKVEIKRAKRLIVEQIPHLADIEFPKRPVEDDGTLRPLFIGAFSKDGLIGAAFVTPGIQAAQSFLGYFSASAGAYQCAELVRRTVAEVEGIAVVDEYRRRGVALALKRYIDAWAANHGACLVLSVPTNEAARGLNEKSGHRVLEPMSFSCFRSYMPTAVPAPFLCFGTWAGGRIQLLGIPSNRQTWRDVRQGGTMSFRRFLSWSIR